jgi:signal transduction histidine kinase
MLTPPLRRPRPGASTTRLDTLVRLARDAERLKIARELHDAVLPWLLVVTMNAELVPGLGDGAAARRLAEAARHALAETRLAVTRARLPGEPRSPLAAVRELCALVDRLPGLRCRCVVRVEGPVAPRVLRAAQLIVQEGLANALQHAAAHRIAVLVTATASSLRLVVADNGTRPATVPVGRHGLGKRGIRNRARRLGGSVTWLRRRGGGQALVAELPLGTLTPGARSAPRAGRAAARPAPVPA